MILERKPATEFEEIGTVQFVTIFKRNSYELTKPDGVGGTTRKSSEKSSEKIIAAIVSNPDISARQLAEAIGITPCGVEKHLEKLRVQGVIRRVGPDKGGSILSRVDSYKNR